MATRRRIPQDLRHRLLEEAGHACSYCRSPAIAGIAMAIDHIIPLAAGGSNTPTNLCIACYRCNEFKGVRTTGEDPLTGSLSTLYNPKLHRWLDHFAWSKDGLYIVGLTDLGRATVETLRMNDQVLRQARAIWMLAGIHPPLESGE